MKRSYEEIVRLFKPKKMLFISGPRQAGKTTFSKSIGSEHTRYLNWDIPEERDTILKVVFTEQIKTTTDDFLILDEIHKYHRWKPALKGLYDRGLPLLRIVVTGSARLDVFQKSGESLLGRYEQLRLHPLSLGEITHGRWVEPPQDWMKLKGTACADTLSRLDKFSGFPEPYFENDEKFYTRWSARRRDLLLHEDLRELTGIKLLSQVGEFGMVIPARVGSLLSLNSLRETIGVSHDSIQSWLLAFERLYYVYRISSYSRSIDRAIKKSQKLYMWDWAQVEDPGARHENLVASHLLKSIHLWNDLGYGDFELRYLRNKQMHEIDFLVMNKKKPIVAIEVKSQSNQVSANWFQFEKALKDIPKIQLTANQGVDQVTAAGIRVVSTDLFLTGLN